MTTTDKIIEETLKEWCEEWFGDGYEDLDIQDLKTKLQENLNESKLRNMWKRM